MKMLELVESAKAADEAVFEGTPDKRSAKIVAAALRDLGRRLEEADDGRVAVAGFGTFVVREKTGDKEKRIIFRPAAARQAGGEGGSRRARTPRGRKADAASA